ncbi:hypothetical protein TrLO_g1487 [Triparma laevis f. longispina]|uniref:Uncharacterized protein n=1 Tax=Triparma laevis f. longispina TaxID=1714387 RepID=A0A9W7B2J8_9STRA|nr:hypothetical protein TrLO_g1487 [Triparma laevis f. longispina]
MGKSILSQSFILTFNQPCPPPKNNHSYSPSHTSATPLNAIPLTPSPPPPPTYTPLQTTYTFLSTSYTNLQTYTSTRPILKSLVNTVDGVTRYGIDKALNLAGEDVRKHVNSNLPQKIDNKLNPYIHSTLTKTTEAYEQAQKTAAVAKIVKPVVDVAVKVLPVETAKKVSVWIFESAWKYTSGSRIEG